MAAQAFGVRGQSEAATPLWMSDKVQFVVPTSVLKGLDKLKFVGHRNPKRRRRFTIAGALQSYRSRFVLMFFFLLFSLLGLFLLFGLMFDAHNLSRYRTDLHLVDCALRVADVE